MNTPMEYLQTVRDAVRQLHPTHQTPFYDLLLEHGKEWTPQATPPRYKMGKPKLCFMNATSLAWDNPGLTYVEGYASKIFPVMHAWCIDREGHVIDNTWSDSDQCLYFGIPFKTTFLSETLLRTGYYGILEDLNTTDPNLFLEDQWGITP